MEPVKRITSYFCLYSILFFFVLCWPNNADETAQQETPPLTDFVSDISAGMASIEKTRETILNLTNSESEKDLHVFEKQQPLHPACMQNGQNRCLQTTGAALREYLRNLSTRLVAVKKASINYNDPELKTKLTNLGCLSVAIIDLREVQATVGLFKQGVVSRVRIDKNLLEHYKEHCDGQLLPLMFHQHEKSVDMAPRGELNKEGSCAAPKTGGHHDPGFACGPTGASACKNLNIAPSSALKGTPLFSGKYTCNPKVYALRPFACHAGDISGKLGVGVDSSPDSTRPDFRQIALDTHGDNPCVAAENKNSLVLHCKSTLYRYACSPFHRVETAKGHIPDLLRELLKTATSAVPYAWTQSALLASLIFIREVEQRIEILENVADIKSPADMGVQESQKTEEQ